MRFRYLAPHRRSKAKDADQHEDLRTDLKIVEQALDALEEANRKFAVDFEAWRQDWRTKLGMLDIAPAREAMFNTANDTNGSADTLDEADESRINLSTSLTNTTQPSDPKDMPLEAHLEAYPELLDEPQLRDGLQIDPAFNFQLAPGSG